SKRAQSGYITDREVSKQWLEAKRLAGIPESVVLYRARHRLLVFSFVVGSNSPAKRLLSERVGFDNSETSYLSSSQAHQSQTTLATR
ncbi:MAG: hypothetical protein WCB11_25880, partial [Terriglobales bacterium]